MRTRPLLEAVSRRQLLKSAAAAAITVPAWRAGRGWAQSPNESLRIASVGVGGMGWSDLNAVSAGKGVQIAALCDIDAKNLAKAADRFPAANTYRDYRRLFDELGDALDAVVVSTPDHMHAAVALGAISHGLHVYVQKPLAHNLSELRAMRDKAATAGVVTQMGTQIHSDSAYRTAANALRTGVIGRVSEVHSWVSRSWGGTLAKRPSGNDPVPPHVAWDLWLGVAPERPFLNKRYHPANWRIVRDFGTGTLGDMGCHLFDPVFGGLGLKELLSAESRGPASTAEEHAPNGDVTYEFAGTEQTAETLRVYWTDGSTPGVEHARAAQLPTGESLPGAGSYLVGERGVMVLPHWSAPRVYRKGERVGVRVETLPSRNHYTEWTDACRGEGETSAPFAYSAPINEAVLAGVVAMTLPGVRLEWDTHRMSFNDDRATALVRRSYREGWEIF